MNILTVKGSIFIAENITMVEAREITYPTIAYSGDPQPLKTSFVTTIGVVGGYHRDFPQPNIKAAEELRDKIKAALHKLSGLIQEVE